MTKDKGCIIILYIYMDGWMDGYTDIYKLICVWGYDYCITCMFTQNLINNTLIFF